MIIGTILSTISICIASLLGITSYFNHFESNNPELINRIRSSLAIKPPFFLSDKESLYYEQADLLWENKNISLWKWHDKFRVYLLRINNANGIETLNDQRFFWMGGEPTQVWLATSRSGVIKMTLDIISGPSLPDFAARHLRIHLPDGSVINRKVLPGQISLEIPIESNGPIMLSIQILDKPTIRMLPSGDTRPLLMGVKNITFDWIR
jgi:hypothetical protein